MASQGPPFQAHPNPVPSSVRMWIRQHIPYTPGPPIRIHYMSDLRLWETNYTFEIHQKWHTRRKAMRWRPKKANMTDEFLVLAGNCFRLMDEKGMAAWLKNTSRRYGCILVVPGTTEFYGDSMARGVRKIEDMSRRRGIWKDDAFANVRVLNRGRFDVPDSDVSIVGCTLFSDIPHSKFDEAEDGCEAFRNVKGWSPEHHNILHKVDLRWLQDEVAKTYMLGRRSIVVTSHAPSLVGTILPDNDGGVPEALGSNCLMYGTWKGVESWIYGGTGVSSEFVTVEEMKVMSNQPGMGVKGGNMKRSDNTWDVKKVLKAEKLSPWKVRQINMGRKRLRRTASERTTRDSVPLVDNSDHDEGVHEGVDEPGERVSTPRPDTSAGDEDGGRGGILGDMVRRTTTNSGMMPVTSLPLTDEQASVYLQQLGTWYYDRRPGEE